MDERREGALRWALPDLEAALRWCRERQAAVVRCVLDALGEYAHAEAQASRARDLVLECARALGGGPRGASIAVKPSALGANFDRGLCAGILEGLTAELARSGIPAELDMEGPPQVQFTVDEAARLRRLGGDVTLCLQAYLDRTEGDLKRALEAGVRVRLVKGAYEGDGEDFGDIQRRFKRLAGLLADGGAPFCLGTHDPELLRWLEGESPRFKERAELGFLKGLAELTMLRMAREGWKVSEYVPFGKESGPYIARRRRYLKDLDCLRRAPAP